MSTTKRTAEIQAKNNVVQSGIANKPVLVKKNEVCYTIIETFLWSGMDAGVYVKDKVIKREEDWFTTKESAITEAIEHCKRWGSNLVFLGLEEKIIEGNTYYKPTFNVWD